MHLVHSAIQYICRLEHEMAAIQKKALADFRNMDLRIFGSQTGKAIPISSIQQVFETYK
jgi:hypothetical protein